MKNVPLREDIPRLYLEEMLSTPQIARKVGLSVGAVGSILKTRGVKLRSSKEGLRVRFPDGRTGEQAANWKGGKHLQRSGYIVVYAPGHPRAGKLGRVFEHILVAEETLGRFLTKDEVVHHINGDKADNRPENLEVILRRDHARKHFTSGKNIQELLAENEKLRAEMEELKKERT